MQPRFDTLTESGLAKLRKKVSSAGLLLPLSSAQQVGSFPVGAENSVSSLTRKILINRYRPHSQCTHVQNISIEIYKCGQMINTIIHLIQVNLKIK